jgi:hypothetical protein
VACGQAKDPTVVKLWQAPENPGPGTVVAGPGLSVVADAPAALDKAPWALEMWVAWPEGSTPLRKPAVLAECAGASYSWLLEFDFAASLKFTWRTADYIRVVVSSYLIDSFKPGTWYHVAVVVNGGNWTTLYVTEAGTPLAQDTGGRQNLEPRGLGKGEKARLAIGRTLGSGEPSDVRIGSAAVHARLLTPAEFRVLGGARLPKGVRLEGDFKWGNLGRAYRVARDTIVFTAGDRENGWWGFRLRGAKDLRLTFWHFPRDAMGLSAFVSEDGGTTWLPPNGGAIRTSEGTLDLTFTHTFATAEAILVSSPPVTNEMVDRWFDATAARLGARVHLVGRSREGRPLRVMEIGNPDAPLIYLQAGQHSMQERLGYYMIAPAFEAAAADPELMAKTRWQIMPLVNVDSWSVNPIDGNLNRFWLADEGPPTIMALTKFLKAETDRTGGLVMADWHGGGCWRGHTMLNAFPKEYSEPGGPAAPAPGVPQADWPPWFSDPETNWNSLHTKRESALPEFEACMREEGLTYLALNGYERNRSTYGKIGYFEDLVMNFRGVKAPLCVELSSIVAETPDGAEPVSLRNLREDGVRWYRAIKRYVYRHL